jgi:nucleoside phosphorylase
LKKGFPNLKLAILVGICGGVPSAVTKEEMLLGDVVISTNLIRHDIGRQFPGFFQMYNKPEDQLGDMSYVRENMVALLHTDQWHAKLQNEAKLHFCQLQQMALSKHQHAKYMYPGTASDRLFEPAYSHKHQPFTSHICAQCQHNPDAPCEDSRYSPCREVGCSDGHVIQRSRLEQGRTRERQGLVDVSQAFHVFLGRVASGNMLMRSGKDRDRIAKPNSIMAFEMEGVGVWEQVPSLIIKGVSDYVDSHKNDVWQGYAAATAASATRALLDGHKQFLLAGLKDKNAQPSHRVSAKTPLMYLSRHETPQGPCKRFDYDHDLQDCFAADRTVRKAREIRKAEGSCINCGEHDHWWEECRYDDLRWR